MHELLEYLCLSYEPLLLYHLSFDLGIEHKADPNIQSIYTDTSSNTMAIQSNQLYSSHESEHALLKDWPRRKFSSWDETDIEDRATWKIKKQVFFSEYSSTSVYWLNSTDKYKSYPREDIRSFRMAADQDDQLIRRLIASLPMESHEAVKHLLNTDMELLGI